jgi:two-component system NtrC family sensor kinase
LNASPFQSTAFCIGNELNSGHETNKPDCNHKPSMKRNSLFYFFILLLLVSKFAYSQTSVADSVNKLLAQKLPDTSRILLKIKLSNAYTFFMPDSGMLIIQEAMKESQQLHFAAGEAKALNVFGSLLRSVGELPQALEYYFQALQLSRAIHDTEEETRSLIFMGYVYTQLGEYRQSIFYLQEAQKIKGHSTHSDILLLTSMGTNYESINLLDSALYYHQQAFALLKKIPRSTLGSLVLTNLGIVYSRLKNHSLALNYYHSAFENAVIIGDLLNRGRIQYRIADLYYHLNKPDSSLFYARLSFYNSIRVSQSSQLNASSLLVKLFEASNQDSAFHYQTIAMAAKDSIFGPNKFQRLQMFTLKEQQRQQEILHEQERYKNKMRIVALLVMAFFLLVIAIILLRNNRNKQKINQLLYNQKNELQQTLTILKSTQNQLVQREKMASLGELTSGIAHEIQNPLNFVNNFSEVNTELIGEMRHEIDKGNAEEVKKIAGEISDNEQKIMYHGKRADTIVKSMLLHSRSSSNHVKSLTDINLLADEYLRLSYNGIKAANKLFTAKTKTDFDKQLPQINIVPEDIGRVLLNLYNNAFYAVIEKAKTVSSQTTENYEPMVTVSTRKSGDKIIITVKDNGDGIPQQIRDKIFHPFFTTKPTGQGTGLGLSLSYDIVKAHDGELNVETATCEELPEQTKSDAFAIFTVLLPA